MKGCRSSSSYPYSFSRLRERDPAEKEEGRKEGRRRQSIMDDVTVSRKKRRDALAG